MMIEASSVRYPPVMSTRWLSDDEQAAWRALAGLMLRLPGALESQLQRDSGLTHFEYWVLALLSEAPDRALRLSHLAQQANASLSRLSHVVTRLERRGWLTRQPDPSDARATRAVLSDEGMAAVVAAAPGHVEHVRRLVFDRLDDAEVEELASVCRRILDRLASTGDGRDLLADARTPGDNAGT